MIQEILKDLNIDYEEVHHPPVSTSEEGEKYYSNFSGGKSKNLFLCTKKKDKHYLILLESNKMIDLKLLSTLLNEKRLGFASPERLLKYLGLTPGTVSPFGLINDINHDVIVFIDSSLLKYEKLVFHPNENTVGLIIDTQDFIKYLKWVGNTYKSVDLPIISN